jgi:DNA-binding transcriptional ArsR family regulator
MFPNDAMRASPDPRVEIHRASDGNRCVTVTPMLPNADPFMALGDENRRAILRLLAGGERSVGQLASSMPISRPAVSRHLRLLREAGLVKERAVGTRRLYALDDLGAEAVREYIESVWGEALARYRIVAENTPRARGRPR